MAYTMPYLKAHPKTRIIWFRRAYPLHLRVKLGQELKRSMGTRDMAEAKRLIAAVLADYDAAVSVAEGGPVRLTHRQVTALAGLWRTREIARHEDDPGPAENWGELLSILGDQETPKERAKFIGGYVDALLTAEKLSIDQDTRERLSEALFWQVVESARVLVRRADGDYSKDHGPPSLPAWQPPGEDNNGGQGVTLMDIFDKWAASGQGNAKTVYGWRGKLQSLIDHVGHDDPTTITKRDALAWKAALLAGDRHPNTVANYLVVASTIFNFGVDNELITSNPIKGTKTGRGQESSRDKPYTDDDLRRILTMARSEKGYRRWVPWLLAFTGARLQEVTQLMKEDVREEGAIWFIFVTNEGDGQAVKNSSSKRRIPLHPALISEGFIEYVRKLSAGSGVFADITPDRFGAKGGNASKALGRWVRKTVGITDPAKAPNHAWRHRFKDACREAGIPVDIHDHLTGHRPMNVGARYGMALGVLAGAVEKLPNPMAGSDSVS